MMRYICPVLERSVSSWIRSRTVGKSAIALQFCICIVCSQKDYNITLTRVLANAIQQD